MKIKNVIEFKGYYVETDEEEYAFYTRHSSGSWMSTIGESEELLYDCKEIERLFQEYFRKTKENK